MSLEKHISITRAQGKGFVKWKLKVFIVIFPTLPYPDIDIQFMVARSKLTFKKRGVFFLDMDVKTSMNMENYCSVLD